MTCNFHVGQKVVCINGEMKDREAADFYSSKGIVFPSKGTIYTIRQILWLEDFYALRLEEIVNPIVRYKEHTLEHAFHVDRFRPLVERKTDISQFKAMLNYQPKVVVIS